MSWSVPVILPGDFRTPLLWRYLWRHVRSLPWHTWTHFTGIMLGVMMVVAVDLASHSARRAFELSRETITGTITHQIRGGESGVEDQIFVRLKRELGMRRAAPSISGQVSVEGQSLTLVGLDPFSERNLARQRPGMAGLDLGLRGPMVGQLMFGADAVVMSEGMASGLGVRAGDELLLRSRVRERQVTLGAVFANADPLASQGVLFGDIALAQTLLGRMGYLDSIDLVLSEAEVEQLRSWLPSSLSLVEAGQQDAMLEHMSEAFHVNLLAMSLLSLLVAALLIHNTVSLSVLRRQAVLALLRAQGVTRGGVFQMVLLETGMLSLLASLAGVVLGVVLGSGLVRLVSRTIEDLYFQSQVSAYQIEPMILLQGLALGVGIALASAALPAWQAASARPARLEQVDVKDRRWQQRLPWLFVAGLGLMLASSLWLQPHQTSLWLAFAGLALLITGFCLLVPALLSSLLWLPRAITRHFSGPTLPLALQGIRVGIGRSGMAVAALTVALSVTVGVGVMVGSFRDTVVTWLEQSLPGDIQVSSREAGGFDADQVALIAALPGVETASASLQTQVESSRGRLRLLVNEQADQGQLYLKQADASALVGYLTAQGILVSEPLAALGGVEPGESLLLFTAEGAREFPVLGIFHDYTSGAGMIAMQSSLYQRWWGEFQPNRLAVGAAPGSGIAALAESLEREVAAAGMRASVITNGQLRQLTLDVFDRTFAITNVLRLLAILVAFAGVLCALMALQLERGRELALLRATGMTKTQVAGLVLAQTGLMGLCAGILALPLGLLMSHVLIDIINWRAFGWSMQTLVPAGVLVEAMALGMLAALLAGLYPAWRAAAIEPALALREE